MEVKIRPAKHSDIQALKKFELDLIALENPINPFYKEDEEIDYFDFPEMIDSEDVNLLIAESEGKPIGNGYGKIMEYQSKEGFYGYIGAMFIEEPYRGKGIGQSMVKQLITWLQSRNIEDIKLSVYLKNESAIKAYEKMGFHKYLISMKYDPDLK